MWYWAPSDDLICALAHAVAGYAFAITGAWLGRVRRALLALAIWGSLKEFVFDPAVEGQTFSGGAGDFAAYAVGAILALALIWAERRFRGTARVRGRAL